MIQRCLGTVHAKRVQYGLGKTIPTASRENVRTDKHLNGRPRATWSETTEGVGNRKPFYMSDQRRSIGAVQW